MKIQFFRQRGTFDWNSRRGSVGVLLLLSCLQLYCAFSSSDSGSLGRLGSGSSLFKLTDQMAASVVLGQPNFDSGDVNRGGLDPAGDTLNAPYGNVVVTPSGKLIVPDTGNHRVLIFNQIPSANDAPSATANLVLGQDDLITDSGGGVTEQDFLSPGSLALSGSKLLVSDSSASRILIFNSLPTSNHASANVVVGQPDFASTETGCAANRFSDYVDQISVTPTGRLLVADYHNHRILIFNSVPTSNEASANLVLGQSNFTTCSQGPGGVNPQMANPSGVWSNGTKVVVVEGSGRILIWNTFPTTSGKAPDLILTEGVTADPSSFDLGGLNHVWSNGTQLFTAGYNPDRVLVWDQIPTSTSSVVSHVLGQSNYNNSEIGTNSILFSSPASVYQYGSRLFVTDQNNHRIMIFNSR